MSGLQTLNSLSEPDAREELRKCCGSSRWVDQMLARRPFANVAELEKAAADAERELTRVDWLEAFSAHPKIGDMNSLRSKFAHTAAWSAQEQGSVNHAAEATLLALSEGNREYEQRYGHIFIVCATGKSAEEMLAILQQRMNNDADTELSIAANEQKKITRLRLARLHS